MSKSLPDISETNQQMVNDIQSLQNIEQQMFSQLENNPGMTNDQKEKIIKKIKKISDMRMNLYQTMGGINSFFNNALSSSRGTLNDQTAAIKMSEGQLNGAKQKLKMLETERNNSLRLTEINTYYGERYEEHAFAMKVIVFTLVPIIVLAILNQKGIINNTIYYVLIGIIAAIGAFFLINVFLSIIKRDNMDYQNYNWAAPSDSSGSRSDASGSPWTSKAGGCVDSACCADGTSYDSDQDQCLPESFTTLESMVNKELTKTSTTNPYKTNNNSNFQPVNSDSFINFKM